jgi:hypothetical protein
MSFRTFLSRVGLGLALVGCTDDREEQVAVPEPNNALDTLEAIDARPAPTPFVVINEVMTANDSVIAGPGGDYGDWIEIANIGAAPFDLSRASIEEGGLLWRGSGVLPPGGRALIWGPSTDGSSGFALGSDGDVVELQVDGFVVDVVEVPALRDDQSWARFPDGLGAFGRSSRPTPSLDNGSASPSGDVDAALFQDHWLLDIDLTPGDAGIDALRADPRTIVPAGFSFEQTVFPSVGMRIKGGWGSTRSIDQKASIRIDLDAFEDRELRGLETVTLNNLVQDASYVHESLAYTLFRAAGVPAPRVGWARLWINGKLHGLMTHIETVDRRFLARWFEDPTGTMFEGAYGSDFRVGESWNFELDEGEDDREAIEAIAAVISAGRATDARIAELDTLFDLANLRTVMAVEALTLHWDGYSTSNNYRIYRDPLTGRFSMIPWGTDQTFVDYWMGPWDGAGELFKFCLQNQGCEQAYNRELLRVSRLMEDLPLRDQLDARAAWLRPDIEEDPRREFGVDSHDWSVETTRMTLETWPAEVRRQVRERR